MEQARKVDLAQIEREQFSLSNGQIISQSPMENTSRISFAKCQTKVYLIGQLVTNQILTYFDKKYCSLSNGENRNSLSNIVFQLFKKQPMVLYFGTDSRNCLDLFGATWNYLELLEATWSYLVVLEN